MSAPTSCPLCAGPLDAGRCLQCGAAAMPGGYQVQRLLAHNPHGRLYLARGPDGAQVALKEILFALVPDVAQLERFEREARLLREVSHPHIPRFIASFQEGSGVHTRLYLAQQFIPGASLREGLAQRRLTEEEALDVARQVLGVLHYLHSLSPPIVHRDVKPANLVRREDGTLFLVDFGAARDLFGGGTRGATLVGTFGYMPPEQLGGTLDATCDLYALGASLLHLLSGKPPEAMLGPDLALDFTRHLRVSPKLERFLSRLVARDPAARFRTALDAALALESPTGDTPATSPWPRRLLLGGALGAVAAGVALLWPASPEVPAVQPPPAPVQPTTPTTPVRAPTPPAPTAAPPADAGTPDPWRPQPPPLAEHRPHARWRFDEDPNLRTLRDDMGRFDEPRVLLWRTPGVHGGAMQLRVSNLNTWRLLQGVSEGSFTLWLQRGATQASGWVLAATLPPTSSHFHAPRRLGLGLHVEKDGRLKFEAQGRRALVTPTPLAPGVFHPVVLTWGQEGRRLFVGGKLVARDPRPFRLEPSREWSLQLGQDPKTRRGPERPMALDDLTLYTHALPAEAVARLAALEANTPGVAGGPRLSRRLLADDFSQGIQRWVARAFLPPATGQLAIVEEAGNPHLRLERRDRLSSTGSFAALALAETQVGLVNNVWVELDVRLTEEDASAPGPGPSTGQGLILRVETTTDAGHSGVAFLAFSSQPAATPAEKPLARNGLFHAVRQQQVRLGEWRRERVELNALFAPLGAGRVVQVRTVELLGQGRGLVGGIDNLVVSEE